MVPIGEMLRHAREAQGLSLENVATELCVTQRYLRAIEAGDVASLPGSFFFASFARQYAAILRLDPVEVSVALADIAEPVEKPATPPPSSSPVTFSRFQLPSGSSREFSPLRSLDPIVADTNRRYFSGAMGLSWAGLVAAVLVGSGIFAWWTRPPQTIRPEAVRMTPAVPAKALPVASPATPVTQQPSAGTQTPDVSAMPVEGVSLQASNNQAQSNQTPNTQTMNNADGGKQVTLNLSATERTWLSITSHGKVIFSGILEPSQSKTLQGSEVATMKIGNAGGVDVQWNGKSIGPIGARGQVRTVRFTSEDFKILEPDQL